MTHNEYAPNPASTSAATKALVRRDEVGEEAAMVVMLHEYVVA